MYRLSSILVPVLTLAVAGAPAAALAQAFPASAAAVAGVNSLGSDTRAFIRLDRNAAAQWRVRSALPPTAPTDHPQALKLQSRIALNDTRAPLVDIRAKADWSDDQGLRATPTRVSYKQRF